MRELHKLDEIPECQLVRQTLFDKLAMDELQLRLPEAEIESTPFGSLDFVEPVISLEQVFGLTIPLSSAKVDLAGRHK